MGFCRGCTAWVQENLAWRRENCAWVQENYAWVVRYVRKISTNLPGMREVNVKMSWSIKEFGWIWLMEVGKYSVWIIFIIWVD